MSQAGYTPISLYYSTTAAAVPTSGNLVAGELAINTLDGKLYYKNSAGTVTLLASSTTVTNSFSAGTTGLTPNTATTGAVTLAGTLVVGNGGTGQTTLATGALGYGQGASAHASLAIGTAGQILTVNSGATAPQWTTLTGVAVTTFSAGTTGLTPSTATSGAVTLAGTLATTNGGTGLTSFTANQVFYASSTSAFAQSTNLQFSGTDLTVYGITVGRGAGAVATNTAVGSSALAANTSGSLNTAVGYEALATNTDNSANTAVGYRALKTQGAGVYQNTAMGAEALTANITGVNNSAFGRSAMLKNTSGGNNVAVGFETLRENLSSSNNTAIGYQAGYGANGASTCIFIGPASGYGVAGAVTGTGNTVIGPSAGASLTSGTYNTFVGPNGQINQGTGGLITIGSKNTILGGYNGNQNSLDIRTASKYVVLSDGDGVPNFVSNNSGQDSFLPGASPLYVASDTFASNLHIGNNVALMSYGVAGNRQLQLASNLYYYNGGYRYKTSNGASKLSVGTLGGWDFSGAVAGTADAVAAMVSTLGTDGNGYTVYLQGGATSQSGTGITFPATQSASSNANTLDDYEEGTWTTTFNSPVNLTGTPTLSGATYTKIGNVVQLVGRITGYSIVSSNTATYAVPNLPFSMLTSNSPISGGTFGSSGSTYFAGTICDNSSGEATSFATIIPAVSVTTTGAITIDFSVTYQAA